MESARARLLEWFDRSARDLPWRRTRDPYAIWVSEVMLQQTRVDTVIPYFERFIARYPTLRALAEADEDDVLSAWSGLGYYRRARLLLAGVRQAHARYGCVPEDADSRRALPGVGDYTAGAIGSIAFGREEPIVDGNVARVFARHFAIEAPITARATKERLWSLARAWAVGARPGDANQALMELGATVCTPRKPDCAACPLAGSCAVAGTERAERLPVVEKKAAAREVELLALLARDGAGRLGVIRHAGELFHGLHGLPMLELSGDSDVDAALRLLLAEHFPSAPLAPAPLGTVRHVLTHRRMRVTVYAARADAGAPAVRFVTDAELDALGVSTLTRKLLALESTSAAPRPAPTARAGRSRTSARRTAAARAPADPSSAPPSSPAKRRKRAARA